VRGSIPGIFQKEHVPLSQEVIASEKYKPVGNNIDVICGCGPMPIINFNKKVIL